MSASKLQESSEVRIAHSLHTDEEEFVARRRETVFQSLQKLKIHCSQDAVPNIALLGSGGGQRAMVGLLGSLVQLDKEGLLDCILYLSGVSGSTWCMASLYQEPDWSTKLETVKDKIIERLSGPAVSWGDAFDKLKKYYKKDFFSLTDVWAAMAITEYVKEIDEVTLRDQWDHLSKDPFPIYTVIDTQSKKEKEKGGDKDDPWFEISPVEAGYSLTGAFVETSSFGSKFDRGSKKNPQDEMDMLYLQALCGSALADRSEIFKYLWQKIKDLFKNLTPLIESDTFEEMMKEPKAPPAYKCYQVLIDLVEVNLAVLNGKDYSALVQTIKTTLEELGGGTNHLIIPGEKTLAEKQAANFDVKKFTEHVLKDLSCLFSSDSFDLVWSICKCLTWWIWGRNYNFLHKMKNEAVPAALLEGETRDYEDAGLLLNSPYFSVLRKERNIDLIISLDFSDGDPFKTVNTTQKLCEELKIPFPGVNRARENPKNPEGFYVFKGTNTPTVIHIPLFNVVNCGGNIAAWRNRYATFQGPYNLKMITDLMEVAGKNISDNREKLLEQIQAVIDQKRHEL
ncbi:cytosolic phospholipase A2 gamma-like isoform X1 [Carassius auratus]|uniref:Cytosolic phospholipase A2 gamma-like isoform X1 n=1 Tax=Carassius auratus TaxID=7957 RepID=A0A6P6MR55_CARAU|nr:cytosolic phospholipase A2 gamma-like isoform X1 [Carassius auratus]